MSNEILELKLENHRLRVRILDLTAQLNDRNTRLLGAQLQQEYDILQKEVSLHSELLANENGSSGSNK